jgi:hypothetical protein
MIFNQNRNPGYDWGGIGSAEIFERGRYFTAGFKGLVLIKRTIVRDTRGKGMAFICEMEVVTTNMPAEHPIGSKGTWFQKLVDRDIAFPAIAAWAAACAGYEPHQREAIKADVMPLLQDLMKEATDSPDANTFTGTTLLLETVQVTTKKNTPFTRYDFSPAPQ